MTSYTIYILLLTFFLHNGVIETKTISADTKFICEQAKPLIIKEYMGKPVLSGTEEVSINSIVGLCIKVTRSTI